jgi:hypothetical protein
LIGLSILAAWVAAVVWLIKPIVSLNSLEQVDDYPLYAMHYYGAYDKAASTAQLLQQVKSKPPSRLARSFDQPAWSCSLFAALSEPDHQLFGRNFDWQFSPALLLFTNPPDGYASVSMVDIAYLGFRGSEAGTLTDLSLLDRSPLLQAPFLPFDGMNEHGLVLGMAAVPPGGMRPDPNKETIGSLMVMRELLDHARDVDEAVAILDSYNIDMGGGPPIHYLVADPSGRAVLVEFYQGEMAVIPNQAPWHLATNFLRISAGASPQGRCWRYDTIQQRLAELDGRINRQEAMNLLAEVSQASTQWSIVYEMSSGRINVTMGRDYEDSHAFHLRLAGR